MKKSNSSGIIIIVVIVCVLCVSLLSSISGGSGIMAFASNKNKQEETIAPAPKQEEENKGIKVQVRQGMYNSEYYGYKEDNGGKYMCPPGSYVARALLFHGQDRYTNAWNAFCIDPKSSKVTQLFPHPTCGKRDRRTFAAVISSLTGAITNIFKSAFTLKFKDIAQTIKNLDNAQKDILKPGFGRKLWNVHNFQSIEGINGWDVAANEGAKGLEGVQLHGVNGKRSGWAGGGQGNVKSGKCPPGKVVVGISSRCGDRVDGIGFHCDIPSNPKPNSP